MKRRERQLLRRIGTSMRNTRRGTKRTLAVSAIGALLVPLLPAAASSAAALPGTRCTQIPGALAAQGVQATAKIVEATPPGPRPTARSTSTPSGRSTSASSCRSTPVTAGPAVPGPARGTGG